MSHEIKSQNPELLSALSESQIQALGGLGELRTWLDWLRGKKEFLVPFVKGFEEFAAATNWRGRLGALGGVMDAMGPVFEDSPSQLSTVALSLDHASDEDATESTVRALEALKLDAAAFGIPWGNLVGKLPQLISFIQLITELLNRFKSPAGVSALSIDDVHGLRYRPFTMVSASPNEE